MQTFPFFGVLPELLDEDGHIVEGEGEGYLVFRQPWPGMMRTLYGNHKRFQSAYFERFKGYYCTGDGKCFFIFILHTFYSKTTQLYSRYFAKGFRYFSPTYLVSLPSSSSILKI